MSKFGEAYFESDANFSMSFRMVLTRRPSELDILWLSLKILPLVLRIVGSILVFRISIIHEYDLAGGSIVHGN